MSKLTLLDLECFLIDDNKKKFDVEINEEKIHNVDSDELWKKIHSNDIRAAEIFEDDLVYIKLFNPEKNEEEEIIMFL